MDKISHIGEDYPGLRIREQNGIGVMFHVKQCLSNAELGAFGEDSGAR